ncbi:GTP 3',8-cyclase MoaA [Sphingorhabdus sp.]|uniref:GTP 3',8-cyclase MoaA n=1 Tax=Sphingorhabdus sp. TaxID=1902408 RepID=UPI00391CB252
MIDGFGRKIDYLRISVTDRCNFRCSYCMPEQQSFLPHRDLLTYDEIMVLVGRVIAHGIRKVRLTGGEPLVRRDIEVLIEALGQHVQKGNLDELTMTTNGSRLEEFAPYLASAGMKRINVSMDTLDSEAFRRISRGGDLNRVLAGIHTARAHGLDIKINMVALKGENEDALMPMAAFCAEHGFDLTLIETMPLGAGVSEREERYLSLDEFTAPLRERYDLHPLAHKSAGPARYWRVEPLNLRIGLITPMSHNFCDQCNRIRLTTDGKIYMCLGSELHVDLRTALRSGTPCDVDHLLQTALRLKPQRHDFETQLAQPDLRLARHMNATGG